MYLNKYKVIYEFKIYFFRAKTSFHIRGGDRISFGCDFFGSFDLFEVMTFPADAGLTAGFLVLLFDDVCLLLLADLTLGLAFSGTSIGCQGTGL